ncbi:alpha/beta hydrolase [Mucilaginibacter sp. BJC16-A38]|uniref:alpha/beta fold hydrolase n=1 Tax=Mucilaginibacter phenanthrenivorans TaxID=1234842 RepID=UPI002157D65B|nr:alpha/beta hydrolase [Mucilaginibacter phenanthrenivorans]MCR8557347.1 alpha/beta hydrolase [Mucilaginibacter phenanthrenivorans]
MKNSKTLQIFKISAFFVLLGLSIASCKKDYPNNQDYHQTAVTQFVVVSGTRIAYRVLGNAQGTPLVMVSALGASMDDWDPAITDGLASKNKVILFDLPGVGWSGGTTPDNIADMASDAVAFIKALGYSKVNLMGFSMGSFISQQILLTQPVLVNKVILTGTGPKGAQGLSNLPALLATTVGLTPKEVFLKFGFAPSDTSQKAGLACYDRVQKRTNRDSALSTASETAEITAVLGWAKPYPDALKELQSVTQPVFIAQGEEDVPVPVINAENMAKSIPNAILTVYPDSGHSAVFQNYVQFLPAALAFLAK